MKDAQKALGAGGDSKPGNQKGLEDALAQAERLRRQMASLNPGNRGQGSAERGQGQAGSGGDQPGGGQPGVQWRDEPAGRFGGSRRGGGMSGAGWTAINRGEALPGPAGPEAPRTSPQEMERAYREGVRDLGRLRQSLEGNPELARDVQDLIREMQRLDPGRFPGNPELLNQLHARVLAEVEQVELELRRMVDDKEGGRVRSTSGDPAPPGYADAVAEYFRRLSNK